MSDKFKKENLSEEVATDYQKNPDSKEPNDKKDKYDVSELLDNQDSSEDQEYDHQPNNKNIMRVVYFIIWIVLAFLLYYVISWTGYQDVKKTTLGNQSQVSVDNTFKDGKVILISYTWSFDNGDAFDIAKTPVSIKYGDPGVPKPLVEWLVWMKAGETKKIYVQAKDAFWEKTIEKTFPEEMLADTSEQEVPIELFQTKTTKKVNKSQVAGLNVWEMRDLGNGISQKLISIEWDKATVEINNLTPFFTGKFKKWAKSEIQGQPVTILEIKEEVVKVKVENTKSPFYKKSKKIGSKELLPDSKDKYIEIVSISNNEVTVRIDNIHPFAGKNITFDVLVDSVTN